MAQRTELPATILARARPGRIKITEKIPYKAIVNSVPHVSLGGPPRGKLEIFVPYDGDSSFPHDARDDVARALREPLPMETQATGELRRLFDRPRATPATPSTAEVESAPMAAAEARIGYLALTQAQRTRLDESARLARHNGVLPVSIPVRDPHQLTDAEQLAADRYTAHLELKYQLRPPPHHLLKISAAVTDEEVIHAYQERLIAAQTRREKEWQLRGLIRQIALHAGFERGLQFTFRVEIRLPAHVTLPESEADAVRLQAMAFRWPATPSYRQLHLHVDGGEEAPADDGANGGPGVLRYNPAPGEVLWRDIALQPVSDDGRERRGDDRRGGERRYETALITLHVENPADLYRQERLQGWLEVALPTLYSGLRADFYNALGRRETVPVSQKTVIRAELDFDARDCFRHRLYSPYQEIVLPGGVLDDVRLADIEMLLRAEGFTRIHDETLAPRQENGASIGRHLITASRPEGSGYLLLWAIVEGQPLRANRERDGAGDQSFITPHAAGDITVTLRAELIGDRTRPVEAINNLHMLLKEQMDHGRSIE